MALNKSRAAKTARIAGKTKNSQVPLGAMWDKPSLQEFDGRANTQAGDVGREPGGRWSPAYYESGPRIISGDDIRNPGDE